jgi:hypothetical protein
MPPQQAQRVCIILKTSRTRAHPGTPVGFYKLNFEEAFDSKAKRICCLLKYSPCHINFSSQAQRACIMVMTPHESTQRNPRGVLSVSIRGCTRKCNRTQLTDQLKQPQSERRVTLSETTLRFSKIPLGEPINKDFADLPKLLCHNHLHTISADFSE